ncbi:MAG: hypothetical protein ACP5I3_04360 [Thermoproteus sp.]
MAAEVREAIVKTGAEVEDGVLATMPRSLKYTAAQIRSIIESYKSSDISTIINNLSNIRNIEDVILYITILSYLVGNNIKGDGMLEAYSREFEKMDGISASKLRHLLTNILGEEAPINIHVNKILKIIEFLKHKKGTYLWILKEKRLDRFEKDVREFVFENNGGYSIDRGIKLFIRIFIDKNTIPLAYKIAYNKNEVRKYRIHGDFYTTLVAMRSGSFEDVDSPTASKIKQRVARALICRSRKERCDPLRIRLKSVRGLVRTIAYLSGDPIAFERGAYHIGKNYCARLRCEECPIRNVCKKYIFIEVK